MSFLVILLSHLETGSTNTGSPICHLLSKKISIVPILVGALSLAQETSMGRILMPYLKDEKTLFVVSSDFCHWWVIV
jgi:AmmeMemoRadiSam system protein B